MRLLHTTHTYYIPSYLHSRLFVLCVGLLITTTFWNNRHCRPCNSQKQNVVYSIYVYDKKGPPPTSQPQILIYFPTRNHREGKVYHRNDFTITMFFFLSGGFSMFLSYPLARTLQSETLLRQNLVITFGNMPKR